MQSQNLLAPTYGMDISDNAVKPSFST